MANLFREHGLWNALIVLALVVCAGAVSSSQTIASLVSLTVPQNRLPTSCRMRAITSPPKPVVQGGTTRVTAGPPLIYPSNPWSGTTTRLLVETRKRIEKPPSLYYDPPPSQADATETQWVKHVVEAYHALYDLADGSSVEVSAIKFDDLKLALATPSVTTEMLSPSGRDNRIVKGDVVVKLAGNPTTDCFKAIDSYVRGTR
jgi:hypothetical protein